LGGEMDGLQCIANVRLKVAWKARVDNLLVLPYMPIYWQ
jgi:hypothetical protein